jgi:hypothetical protein
VLTTRFLLLSDSSEFVDVVALSLTRGRVCRLQLLLELASAVILGSESCGTRYHILLSQIRDFPFRRLLRLVGLQWRYSTPPPHGIRQLSFEWLLEFTNELSFYNLGQTDGRPPPRTFSVLLCCYLCFVRSYETCLASRCPVMDYTVSVCCSENVCLASRWLAMDFRSGSTIPAFRRHVTIFYLLHS